MNWMAEHRQRVIDLRDVKALQPRNRLLASRLRNARVFMTKDTKQFLNEDALYGLVRQAFFRQAERHEARRLRVPHAS